MSMNPADHSHLAIQLFPSQDANQDWSNWWDPQHATVVPQEVLEGATVVASSSGHGVIPYASEYGEDWFADQLRNIPMITGDEQDSNEIIQVDQNASNGSGYVLVADRELAAILGGHVDRETIYWLLANFKLERNAVMPRGFLYSKYDVFCGVRGKPLMNQACMGKTVRALFRGLETRRLGRRGKSRYHYIGLAINPAGEFAGMVPLEPEEPAPEPGDGERKRRRTLRTTMTSKKLMENPVAKYFEQMDSGNRLEAALDQLEKMLGTRRNRVLIPVRLRHDRAALELPFEDGTIPDGLTKDHVVALLRHFSIHLGLIGHSILSGVLLTLPSIFQNFWHNHLTSLQIPEGFDSSKLDLALHWTPFVEELELCYLELYGTVLKQLVPREDKPLSSQTLDFLYEFAGRYGQWVRAATEKLDQHVQAVLVGSALSFCETLKQMVVLNSALGLVDLVERDRSKATVVAEGFRALSERLVLISNPTNTSDQLALSIQTTDLMDFIAGHDYTLQRWRGWIQNVAQGALQRVAERSQDFHGYEVLSRQDAALEEIRAVVLGLLVEMQKQIERSGKDYATPLTYVLSYYMHYASFALDHLQAKLHRDNFLQHAYKKARTALLEGGILTRPPAPIYEISFFTQRLIGNLSINVFDHQYFGNFEELLHVMHLPNFESDILSRLHRSPRHDGPPDYSEEFADSHSILAQYFQEETVGVAATGQFGYDDSLAFPPDVAAPAFEMLEVQTDGVVPDNDILLQEV